MYPSINVHMFHSLNLHELDIMFDITLLDLNKLNWVRELCNIHIIPNIFSIDTNEKCIQIVGYKLSDTTYMVNSNGSIINIPYTCSNKDIKTGIEYLMQICKNQHIKSNIENKWDPKPYRPE